MRTVSSLDDLETAVEIDPGWLRELEIWQFESGDERRGLQVSHSPLFDSLHITYTYPDGDCERYALDCVQEGDFCFLRCWLVNNGWQYGVPFGSLPFSWEMLRQAVEILPDAQHFLVLLEQPALQWLAKRGVSLDRIIAVTPFMRHEYPLAYLLLLAQSHESWPVQARAIDRSLLARLFGVEKITSGQLAAIRKLLIDGASELEAREAMRVIVQHGERLLPYLSHQHSLRPAIVLLLDWILADVPAVVHCRWFSYETLDGWAAHWGQCYGWAKDAAALFLVQWHFLCWCAVSPASLDSVVRMGFIMRREWDNILRSGRNTRKASLRVRQQVLKRVNTVDLRDACENQLNMLINDFLFNMDEDDWPDEAVFPLHSAPASASFTQVATAGALRKVAQQLENCAASRVEIGMQGKASLWVYSDGATGELCLLQLDPELKWGREAVVEFKGWRNQEPTGTAWKRLHEWLDG